MLIFILVRLKFGGLMQDGMQPSMSAVYRKVMKGCFDNANECLNNTLLKCKLP